MRRLCILAMVGLLLLVGLAACAAAMEGGDPGQAGGSTPPPQATEEADDGPSQPAAPMFENPVLRRDFADPHILHVGDVYYAYSTNAASRNVPFATSTDLVNWEYGPDAMPALPVWAQLGGSYVWAPEVIQIADDQYNLYFTARDKAADRQCIGVAVSDKPEGKFKDNSDAALVCQVDQGGSIDASPFRDEDGTLYLYWKNDGNCCSMPTWIYVQKMSPDGLSLVGEPVQLIRNDRAWERHVIEAPTMWLEDGNYTLFFSGNDYAGPPYAVGYARCDSPTGPCEKAEENPILASVLEGDTPVIGPGHQTVIVDENGQEWLAYHAWQVTSSGTRGGSRYMWLDRLTWDGDTPIIEGPTTVEQPAP